MEKTPDTLQSLLDTMTPEIHQQLKTAVELGRWENGDRLTEAQKENCLQAVIAYDSQFLTREQRVGFVSGKDGCKTPTK